MLEFKDNLAATWAAKFPDLLTQEKENPLKDTTKVLILLITLLIVQSEGKLEDRGSMHSLESLSKITWDHPSRDVFWTTTWEFTITTMPVEFLAIAAIAVEDVAVATSEFTLIQPWGGRLQHGLWSCLGFWRLAVREGRTLVLFPRFSCWTSECKVGPHCVEHRSWDPIIHQWQRSSLRLWRIAEYQEWEMVEVITQVSWCI